MSFTPVELIGPTGNKYTARDAIDLNDRTAEGYCRVEVAEKTVVTPSPTPRAAVNPITSWLRDSDSDSE